MFRDLVVFEWCFSLEMRSLYDCKKKSKSLEEQKKD